MMKSKVITRMFEVVAAYLLLVAANYFLFPETLGWVGLDPHPFWIPVLLFGYRYGLAFGILTGFSSACLYLLLAWHSVDVYLLEDTSFYILPTAFILCGLLLGLLSSRLQSRWEEVTRQEGALESQFSGLTQELKVVKEINRGLEKRIVTKMTTLITLYEGAKGLESVHLEELYAAIGSFVSKAIEAEEVSLYLKNNDNWCLKTSVGIKEYQKVPAIVGLHEGLIGQAGLLKRVVSIRDYIASGHKTHQLSTLGDCLFAGPVRKGRDGEPIGIVAVHKIPFLQFNSATLTLFAFILDWASRSIERACLFEEMRDHEILDPEFQVYSQAYFKSRLAQEFTRAQTYGLPLSVAIAVMPGLSQLPSKEKQTYLTILSHFLRKNCREIDVVCSSSDQDLPFAVIMVTTNANQRNEEINRLINLFQKLELPATKDGRVMELKFKRATLEPGDQFVLDMLHRLEV